MNEITIALKLKAPKFPVKAWLPWLDTSAGPEYPYAAGYRLIQTESPGDDVPNTKSAKKRLRQNLRRRTRNKAARTELKTAVKKVRAATEPQGATESFREAAQLLDRAVSRGLIHKNRAARSKGRLAAHVQRLGGTL